jgi:hypothetical protein
MQKQPCILPAQKLSQQVLGMAIARLEVHHFQDRHYVCQQELSIATRRGPASRRTRWERMQKGKHTQFAADPGTGTRLQRRSGGNHVRRHISIAGERVRSNVERIQIVPVDVPALLQSGILHRRRVGAASSAAAGWCARWRYSAGTWVGATNGVRLWGGRVQVILNRLYFCFAWKY